MKHVILSLFFVITGTFLSAQVPKYAVSDSLGATESGQKALKYLASYYQLIDSVWRLKDGTVFHIATLEARRDSFVEEKEKYRVELDTMRQRLKNGWKITPAVQKKKIAHLEELRKAIKVQITELDSIQNVTADWNDFYWGLAHFSQIQLRHLIGVDVYDKVMATLDSSTVFTYKEKPIFSKKYLPRQ